MALLGATGKGLLGVLIEKSNGLFVCVDITDFRIDERETTPQ